MVKKRTLQNLKLRLNRETLRSLDTLELEGVAGAATVVTCNQLTCPVSNCRRTCINNTCTC
jgi:hypothetical protein